MWKIYFIDANEELVNDLNSDTSFLKTFQTFHQSNTMKKKLFIFENLEKFQMDLRFCNRKLEKKQRKMYFYDQKQNGKKSGERN